jgi:regulator of sirC expression with transglutaminase-like and TPR domain
MDADAIARFAELVAVEEPSIRLDEASLLVAAAARPGADVTAALEALDELAGQASEPTLDGLRRLLFRDLGYGGNPDDYYDPSNSFLDDVIARRVGIPITLAVLMLEVGRRLGVPLAGVSMPGHFLVRDKVDPSVFVDPFARGALLDRGGCAARFFQVHGTTSVFDDSFLEPVGKLVILSRMLANLENVAAMRSDRGMLQRVLRLRVAMPDAAIGEHRKLAASLAASGRFVEAAELLEAFGERSPEEAMTARSVADRLRARLN